MARIFSLLLGLAVVVAVAYWALQQTAGRVDAAGRSEPKQQLDRAREAARRIEVDAQRRSDETFQKTKDSP